LALGPAIVVLVLGATMFDGVRRARDSRALVAHTRDVIDRAQAMFSALQDAETGERGYVITGDSAYLEPYHRGVETLRTDTAALRALTQENLTQRARLDSLSPILRERLATLAAGVASRRAIGFDSAASVVRSGHGKFLMDSIRTIVGNVMTSERSLLERRQAAEATRALVVTWIVVAGTAIAVVLALMLNAALLRHAETEARLHRDVDIRNQQLEEQNLELELQSQQLQEQASELEVQNEELQSTSDALAEQAAELEIQAEQLESTNRALEEANQAAEAARAAAEVANRAKGDFLATMSHELRTPLNAIAGYAQLMQLGVPEPVPAAHHDYLARIQQSQRHLLGVINSVLNFARIEAGSVTYDMGDVAIAALLAEVEPLIAPQMQARGHEYACVPCDPTLVVYADPDKVRQILLNLLSNAVKFTPGGGQITLSAEALVDDPNEKFAAIRVRDTGLGIPPEKLNSIFDPFVQVDASHNRVAEGTGLGLAISRELARGMGGDLVVESAVGVGSTFTLTLALTMPIQAPTATESSPRLSELAN
ncbi:MAG: CHASE3 domain-containing protein, partial [Deltaproteobacteria bacterium]